jgi:hypothetical protein
MKIYQAVQKLLVGTYRQTDRQTGDLISLLSFLESSQQTGFINIYEYVNWVDVTQNKAHWRYFQMTMMEFLAFLIA